MANFTSFSRAVLYALESTDIGTKSSLEKLADRANLYYAGNIGRTITRQGANSTACVVRSKYRKNKGLREDARTYQTQTRRDMRSDTKIPREKWDKAQELLAQVASDKLGELLELFHSIEQAKLAVNTFMATSEFVEMV